MPRRACGCKDDSIQTKRQLLRQIKTNRVPDDGKIIYVGVVTHICFNVANKSETEIDVDYTIDMLNKDFNKSSTNFNGGAAKYTNPDLLNTYQQYVSLASGCNVQFYKVTTKYIALAGQTSSNISVLDRNIKGASPPVEPNRYLNLWVSDLQNGLLGYAQFPWEDSPLTDGVVIAKQTFGRNPEFTEYNLNKTSTHEIGHWLGLYHTFQETFNYDGGVIDYQDGTPQEEIEEIKGDCISDTPPQKDPTYGNPFNNPTTWPTSKPLDEDKAYKHMFMNFMDYSDDIAMFMFTQDQSVKLRQMVHIYRPGILQNNPNPQPPVQPPPVQPPPVPPVQPPPVPPVQPPPVQPPVQPPPVPTPKHITYDFETPQPDGWIGPIKLLNNNIFKTDVQIATNYPHSGTRCLRTKNNGRAELKTNLSGLTKARFSIYIRAKNKYTYVWAKPPGSNFWYSVRIPLDENYQQYSFDLPKPYDSSNGENYIIRIGTRENSSTYSYFDDISIIDVTSSAESHATRETNEELIMIDANLEEVPLKKKSKKLN